MSNSLLALPRVLVVDDMATNRGLLRQVLSPNQYEVSEATGGEEALSLVRTEAYDVVLLDVMMPGMDGFEVCKRIRQDPDLTLLPVILLTALGSPDDVAQGMEVGATDYVSKPFNAVELLARINAAVERKRLIDRLDNTEAVLFSLARMVEARDEDTGDHCDRLSHMGVVFGRELGLAYEEIDALRRGGVLHDIGKLGIPDAVLLKKGKLDADEWRVMKQHTTIGAALCAPLKSMRKTVDIVHCHHERWNGSGYPQGLKGEDIPFLARVFQIVDVFDALSSERPYKPAFPRDKVLSIMEEETAKGYWDPDLVQRFFALVTNKPESLVRDRNAERDRSALIMDEIMDSGVLEWYRKD